VLADLRQENADAAAKTLKDAGFNVSTATVDVSSRFGQVLVEKATSLGEIFGVIHAVGVSPSQPSPETILKVDLYGTALVLEEFGIRFPNAETHSYTQGSVLCCDGAGYRLSCITGGLPYANLWATKVFLPNSLAWA
jgi:hypothetical protein